MRVLSLTYRTSSSQVCTTHSGLGSVGSGTQGGALRADPGLLDATPLGYFGRDAVASRADTEVCPYAERADSVICAILASRTVRNR